MINWTEFRKKVFASRKRVKWQAIVCKKIFFNNRGCIHLVKIYLKSLQINKNDKTNEHFTINYIPTANKLRKGTQLH